MRSGLLEPRFYTTITQFPSQRLDMLSLSTSLHWLGNAATKTPKRLFYTGKPRDVREQSLAIASYCVKRDVFQARGVFKGECGERTEYLSLTCLTVFFSQLL